MYKTKFLQTSVITVALLTQGPCGNAITVENDTDHTAHVTVGAWGGRSTGSHYVNNDFYVGTVEVAPHSVSGVVTLVPQTILKTVDPLKWQNFRWESSVTFSGPGKPINNYRGADGPSHRSLADLLGTEVSTKIHVRESGVKII